MKYFNHLLCTLISLTLVFTACQKEAIDCILYNGSIFTADSDSSYVEALAIKDGKIVAIGSSAEMIKLAGTNTKRIDLKGNLVIPGINDAHYHLSPNPVGAELKLPQQEPTWAEVGAQIKVMTDKEKAGNWILGTIGGNVLLNPEATRSSLDKLCPNNPILLQTYFGHGFIMNTKAMQDMGITEAESDPFGGHYERVSNSEVLNGKFYEYANWNFLRQLAERTPDDVAMQQYKVFGNEALQFGITSVQNMPFFPMERFLKVWDKANIPIRMHAIRFPSTSKDARMVKEGRDLPLNPFKDKPIKVMGTKWILDGTPIERGAALRKTYKDTPNWYGRLNFNEAEIESMVRECLAWNDQLLVHCAGDKPVEVLFDAMFKVSPNINWQQKRFRIEHGDGVVEDLIPRAKELGVVIIQNPTHLSLVDIYQSRHGNNSPFFSLKTFLDKGIPLALGSDGPINPYLNIMLAAINPDRPTEAITREQAVRAYTYGSAYAEFEETTKGTLTIGKVADLAILSQNIFKVPLPDLPKTTSILTMIEGKVVFDAKKLAY